MTDEHPDGATPIDPDEADDLLASHVRTRQELNLWEQENILQAAAWARRARKPALDDSTVHRRMFDRTWTWAGRYRTSDKNLGVDWRLVPSEVRKLVDDGRFWLENGTYSIDEAALRLHHRLVLIHPFPDENGRHARLWCDMLLEQNGRPVFTWKNRELGETGLARRAYIVALRAADEGDYAPLLTLILQGRE